MAEVDTQTRPEPLPPCEFCTTHDLDHRRVGSKPFAVTVGPERDSDGAPDTLHVSYAAGHHLGEGEAEYLRRALRVYRAVPVEVPEDEMVLLTEKCASRDCGRLRYGELTDDLNTHWHVRRGVALVATPPLIAARVRVEERQRLAELILPHHWKTSQVWGGVRREACGRCSYGDGVRWLWPCPTRQALTGEAAPEPDSTLAAVPVATPPVADLDRIRDEFTRVGRTAPDADLLAREVAMLRAASARRPDARRAHDRMVAARALMGVVGEIDDRDTAELVTRRAMQFEDEARRLAVPVVTPCKVECGKPEDQTCAQWGCATTPPRASLSGWFDVTGGPQPTGSRPVTTPTEPEHDHSPDHACSRCDELNQNDGEAHRVADAATSLRSVSIIARLPGRAPVDVGFTSQTDVLRGALRRWVDQRHPAFDPADFELASGLLRRVDAVLEDPSNG